MDLKPALRVEIFKARIVACHGLRAKHCIILFELMAIIKDAVASYGDEGVLERLFGRHPLLGIHNEQFADKVLSCNSYRSAETHFKIYSCNFTHFRPLLVVELKLAAKDV